MYQEHYFYLAFDTDDCAGFVTRNFTFIEFVGVIEPDWNCTLKDGTGYKTFPAPLKDGACTDLKQQCSNFTAIKDSVDFHSIVGAFKMVCEDDNKVEYIQLIQSLAMLIGAVIGGHVGDHLGRNTIFFLCQLCIIITSIMTTASQTWVHYAICQGITGFLYGGIEVMVMTTMMEMTNNKYRLIPNASFQWPLAYLIIALIAYLTKGWQLYFIFLNAVGSFFSIGFIMFLESPRWLIATGQFEEAAEVLNDIAHCRWNDAAVHFTENDLKNLPSEPNQKYRLYNFFHLFSKRKLVQQTLLQMFSMFTYSIISANYNYSVSSWESNIIPFVAINGGLRFIIPIVIIYFDFKIPSLGRKVQFVASLICEGFCYGGVIILMLCGYKHSYSWVNVLITIATMINDSAFWMNIVQITTQRYPTVIRCTAFGFIQCFKHLGYMVGVYIMKPILKSEDPIYAFVIPEVLIVVTIVLGIVLQPEVKGKSLKDTMDEVNKGRIVTRLPTGLLQLVSQFRTDQGAHKSELEEAFKTQMSKAKRSETVLSVASVPTPPHTKPKSSNKDSSKSSTDVLPDTNQRKPKSSSKDSSNIHQRKTPNSSKSSSKASSNVASQVNHGYDSESSLSELDLPTTKKSSSTSTIRF
uniref:MFS domain-containing protein n=1 Tax=Rhabditophanes sp. KR3021 TaxID=114890 RepID=A0AC35UDA5_9BILA